LREGAVEFGVPMIDLFGVAPVDSGL
jgi:hypothetical protein